ncbi:MAG TPA: hypothetical protein DCX07_11430 [Phycisphaerales bacterium]|nr:hypothetical protein [Phycisphaerales bacterium]
MMRKIYIAPLALVVVLAVVADTSSANVLVQTDFNSATVKNYANNELIGGSTDSDLTARVASGYTSTQIVSVVDLGGGNHALQFTDGSTDANGPKALKTITAGDVTTGATGNNHVNIVFDLTLLSLTGTRPTFQFLLNSGTQESSGGTVSAVQFRVTGAAIVKYNNGTTEITGPTLTVGTTYRFTATADLSSDTQDTWSLNVAPVTDLNNPVVNASGLGTRAANVTPGIIVFNGGVDGGTLNTSPYVQLDNISISAVPEPATLGALTLGGILLSAARRRRRSA